MRDEFTNRTKRKLAERVAWRCSFPNCERITVGPDFNDPTKSLNLGEAAHIHSASPNGPRNNPSLTKEERRFIKNGIWICKSHAKMIDADYTNFSASTLRQWKEIAEKKTYQTLKELSKTEISTPLTLISLGKSIVFEGVWKSVKNNLWSFEIGEFIVGSAELLKEYSVEQNAQSGNNYLVVESQGDGRLLTDDFTWQFLEDKYEVSVSVADKQPRTDPHQIGGDIRLTEDGDLEIKDGSFYVVKGLECGIQQIARTLSIGFGELFYAPGFGSYFSNYFHRFRGNRRLLNRLLKIEIIRLISIPYFGDDKEKPRAPLDFVNRVVNVEIQNMEFVKSRIPVALKLEWGNGEIWEGIIKVFVHQAN